MKLSEEKLKKFMEENDITVVIFESGEETGTALRGNKLDLIKAKCAFDEALKHALYENILKNFDVEAAKEM
jgi:tripartite-type tricarboxylate transporter receptor subunit TctC